MFFNALDKSTRRRGRLRLRRHRSPAAHVLPLSRRASIPPTAASDIAAVSRHRSATCTCAPTSWSAACMRKLGPREHFMVISDHGFQTFRRGVNLNTWLLQHGLLHLERRRDDQRRLVRERRLEPHAGVRVRARAACTSISTDAKRRASSRRARRPQALKRRLIAAARRTARCRSGRDRHQRACSIAARFTPRPVSRQRPGSDRRLQPRLSRFVGRRRRPRDRRSVHGQHQGLERRSLRRSAAGAGRAVLELAHAASGAAHPDLAPTILAMFGVGKPRHMTGRVLPVEAPPPNEEPATAHSFCSLPPCVPALRLQAVSIPRAW